MSDKDDTMDINGTRLRYDKMVERALRSVVRAAVEEVMEQGLPDDHHFYITFSTEHAGVKIPDYLKERYPGEMTIVLQYQFHDLSIDDEFLKVTLSFNNIPERLVIPVEAITIFADPAVNFALQFQPVTGDDMDDDQFDGLDDDDEKTGKADDKGKKGEVISLDSFRKK